MYVLISNVRQVLPCPSMPFSSMDVKVYKKEIGMIVSVLYLTPLLFHSGGSDLSLEESVPV